MVWDHHLWILIGLKILREKVLRVENLLTSCLPALSTEITLIPNCYGLLGSFVAIVIPLTQVSVHASIIDCCYGRVYECEFVFDRPRMTRS